MADDLILVPLDHTMGGDDAPRPSQMTQGELAINVTTKKMYVKDNNNEVHQVGGVSLEQLYYVASTKVDKVAGKRLTTNDYTTPEKLLVGTIKDKVEKKEGFDLSSNDYTNEEKKKLAELESSRFKGQFTSLAELVSAFPTGGKAGQYADVENLDKTKVERHIWNALSSSWIAQVGVSTQATPAQIKADYESNPNTNTFTDKDKEKLDAIADEANKTEVVSEKGTSETATMSQKSITDLFDALGENDSEYKRAQPMEITVGGASVGTTFDGTVAEALDKILYPYLKPTFTSFSINSVSTLEVGATLTGGSKVFNWTTSLPDNVKGGSIKITDTTTGTSLITGLNNTGTATITTTPLNKTTTTNHVWTIEGLSTKDNVFNRTFSLSWLWAVYHGESPLLELLPTDVATLRVKELKSSASGSYTMEANNYKWICYPVSMGLKTSFKDVDTLFDVAMNPVQTLSVTNTHGVTTDYYAHRTYNTMGAGIKIAMS